MKLLDLANRWFILGLFAFIGGVVYGMPLTLKSGPTEQQIAAFVAVLGRNTAEADTGRGQ